MRTTAITVTAFTAALLLTACGSGGDGGEGDGKAAATTGGGTACRIGEVDVEVGPANAAPAAGDTGNIPVNITNKGASCTLDGLPGVDVSTGSESVEVPAQQGAKAQKLTLAEGQSASFTITYVRGEEGAADSLAADTLKITLPGDSDDRGFPWTYGPIAGTSAADISVGAFQQAGD
ncbi:DUF4232 domain-containing protein [Streptomyces sp. DH24]|uniref:DUF4232 domain-containing protein n=1 Tax=Streptomyces sp. DH24 TaxID=3040123 RepID=UPI0024429BE9|nr:DUF4232 domain-containing protein [Streptomyces sp. DH24]MDG9717461.1 DUF4232 domain-containing protein [Streptomyces sp. DH24]